MAAKTIARTYRISPETDSLLKAAVAGRDVKSEAAGIDEAVADFFAHLRRRKMNVPVKASRRQRHRVLKGIAVESIEKGALVAAAENRSVKAVTLVTRERPVFLKPGRKSL